MARFLVFWRASVTWLVSILSRHATIAGSVETSCSPESPGTVFMTKVWRDSSSSRAEMRLCSRAIVVGEPWRTATAASSNCAATSSNRFASRTAAARNRARSEFTYPPDYFPRTRILFRLNRTRFPGDSMRLPGRSGLLGTNRGLAATRHCGRYWRGWPTAPSSRPTPQTSRRRSPKSTRCRRLGRRRSLWRRASIGPDTWTTRGRGSGSPPSAISSLWPSGYFGARSLPARATHRRRPRRGAVPPRRFVG